MVATKPFLAQILLSKDAKFSYYAYKHAALLKVCCARTKIP